MGQTDGRDRPRRAPTQGRVAPWPDGGRLATQAVAGAPTAFDIGGRRPSTAPSARRDLQGVQVLRAVAASIVVIHHALEESNGAATAFSPDWLTTSGASGVDVFFVISGFIMFHTSFPAGRPPARPGPFLLRRAARIYPLYWACCVVVSAILSLGFLKHHRLAWDDVLQSLALLPSRNDLISVSWTLIYEVYFYAIFAATLAARSARTSAIATTACIAAAWAMGHGLDPGPYRAFLSNPIAFEFAAGLWLGVAFTRTTAAGRRWAVRPAWALVGFALIAAAPLVVPHATTAGLPGWQRTLAWGLPSTLIVAACLSLASPGNRVQRWLAALGDASYSLYLGHVFVMTGYGLLLRSDAVSRAPQTVMVPIVVGVAILVGVSVHVAVERPLSRAVRRWTGSDRPGAGRRPPL